MAPPSGSSDGELYEATSGQGRTPSVRCAYVHHLYRDTSGGHRVIAVENHDHVLAVKV